MVLHLQLYARSSTSDNDTSNQRPLHPKLAIFPHSDFLRFFTSKCFFIRIGSYYVQRAIISHKAPFALPKHACTGSEFIPNLG